MSFSPNNTLPASLIAQQANLFRHVSAEKVALYRKVMETFTKAKRQFRLHLRPDEVLAEGNWQALPAIDEIQKALSQLTEWGNLEAEPDTARVSSLNDFYRARFIYRLSTGGEAVETALASFARTLAHRAELQTVALEDISSHLQTLQSLADCVEPDAAKVHATLRDLVRVFEGLAENAQAFMAGIGRSLELQQAQVDAVVAYKKRLIDYLERFIRDLVNRSDQIAGHIESLSPRMEALLWQAAQREARDSAPDDSHTRDVTAQGLRAWRERWQGLRRWFITDGHELSQAQLLRSKARAAIPQMLTAISTLNERRSGRSDRSADFRLLASWFADCTDDGEAHRLARAAFALNPARHFSLNPEASDDDIETSANTPWADAPCLSIHPRLRTYGEAAPRGSLPRIQERDKEREYLATQLQEEHAQIEAAREQLASGRTMHLAELDVLDKQAFSLFLSLLGEALTAQTSPDETVEVQSGDGLLQVRLQPLAADSRAEIHTEHGVLSGRDHQITITRLYG